jgi:hypothetical protein
MVPLVGAGSEHTDNEANIVQSMKAYQMKIPACNDFGCENRAFQLMVKETWQMGNLNINQQLAAA